jgi:hypothetical protein
MAFTGVPVVQKIGDSLYRITGVSLAAGAAGTIGPAGTGGGGADPEAVLEGCLWGPYKGEYEAVIQLDESMQVLVNPVGAGVATAVPCRVVKGASGLITITNNDGAGATADLEIYVRYH